MGREPAARPQAVASALEKASDPLPLRLERPEAGLHGLGLEPLAFEGEPDRCVAIAPARERLRPRHGHPVVVDEADQFERLERRGSRAAGSAAVGQPGLELPARQIPVAKRTRGDAERMRPA